MKDDELRFVRIISAIHIPKYLVEQLKDSDFTVEDFYKYQENICMIEKDGMMVLNPLNHLYILLDKENLTKGFAWFTVDQLGQNICIHSFSMDKKYWSKGESSKSVKMLVDFMRDFRKNSGLKKVYWITNYPKHSQKYGFKKSKSILMEYKEEENG